MASPDKGSGSQVTPPPPLPQAEGGEPIGVVSTVSGRAIVIRADGTRIELELDTPLYQGDVLETTGDGSIGVVLADETTLAMGEDSRLILDEMIYDPTTQEGSLTLSITKGVYTFVSGMISKTDPDAMVIDTPVGSIGIRGTQIGIEFSDGENLTIVMMREADGYIGEVFLRNEAGILVINQANQVLFSNGFSIMPVILASVDDATIIGMFERTLLHLPRTTVSANDYGTQEATGGDLDSFTTDSGGSEEDLPVSSDEPVFVAASDEPEPAPIIDPVTAVTSALEEPAIDETVIEPISTETRPEDQVFTAEEEPVTAEPVEESPPVEEPIVEDPPAEEPPAEEEPPSEEPPEEEPPQEDPDLTLKGTGHDDVLQGGGGDDEIRGKGGDDVLYGGAGDDLLRGEGGEDVLYGGAGDDVLKGEGGEDVLVGGAGDDILKGGGGEDTFVFGTDAGNDIILDYHKGEELRFEGPEFSEANMTVNQNSDNSISIMFADQDVAVTLNDTDLGAQSYTVKQDDGALVIIFKETD